MIFFFFNVIKLNGLLNNKNYFLTIAFGLAVLFSFFSSKVIIPIALIFLCIFSNKKIILSLIIISYLSFTSEYFENVRIYITLFSSGCLLYIFLKEYGLQLNKFPKLPTEILVFFFLLLFTLAFSTIFSYNFGISILAFIRMFLFLIIAYMFYAMLINEEMIKVFIYSLLVVVFILGIPMLVDLYNLGLKNYFMRVLLADKFDLTSSRGYTGLTILFITISLITSMFFMKGNNKTFSKISLMVFLIFNVILLILANSRGGILAAIISIAFILFMLKRSILIKTFVGVFGVVFFLILFIPEINEAVNFYMRWETVSDREVYWQMGIDVIIDHPSIGVGPDMFDKLFFNYAPSKTINYFRSDVLMIGKPHPHNFFFYFTAENGILGLITSITFFIIFFYIAFKTIKLTKDVNRDYYILSITITGIGIGLFFRSFIEVSGYLLYGYITHDLPFWLMFGVLISISQKYNAANSAIFKSEN